MRDPQGLGFWAAKSSSTEQRNVERAPPITPPMNQRIDDLARVATRTPLQTAELPVSKGELVANAPRPVVQSGPFKGLDAIDVEAATLNRKKWIGIDPVTKNERPPTVAGSLLRRLLTGVARGIFATRYDVSVTKDDKVSEDVALRGPIKGALVLLTPHTGLDDPAVVYARIAPFLPCRPVGTEGLFTQPGLKDIMRSISALPVPISDSPLGVKDEINLLAVQITSAMRRGENVGLHPSGRLIHGNNELIGSNSLVQRVLELMPESRLISVNTIGMGGSEFTRAFNGGKQANMGKGAKALLDAAKHNLTHPWQTGFRLFKARREVDIEVRDVTETFKAGRSTVEQNRTLEALADRPHPVFGGPNPNIHVPARGDDRSGVHVYTLEKTAGPSASNVVIDPAAIATIEDQVRAHIARLAKTDPSKLEHTHRLSDLNLDSLMLNNDVMLWVNKTFDRNFITPEGFVTVQDVIDGATGVLSPIAGIEFREVSEAFKLQAASGGLSAIPAEARSTVDAFIKQVLANPKRVIAVDEVIGEYTYEDLAVLVSLIRPDIAKIQGNRVGLLFPNSVMSTAVQLALAFEGKSCAMLNAQWNDQQGTSAMNLAGVDAILTAQGAVRALKGKKEREDAERVQKGQLTQAQVDSDPSNTPFPSIEEKFLVVDNYLRELPLLRVLADGKLRKGKMLRRLVADATKLDSAGEIAALFTSGSSGNPKGIAYRHEQVMQSAKALAKAFDLQKNDVLLHLAPSFHLVGFTAGNMATMMGVASVNVPNPQLAAIAAELGKIRQATIVVGTPSLLNALAKAAGTSGLSHLKRIVVGAEALTPEIEANLRKAAPSAQIIQGYGMTETGVTFVERFDPKNPSDRSIGEPLEGVDYKIVSSDDHTREVAQGEPGILVVRGPAVVTSERGFMGKVPSDAFATVGGVEYFVTGDIVRDKVVKDPAGVDRKVVHFMGRASRFSKINGERIGHDVVEAPIAALMPEPRDGGLRAFVVEGVENSAGQPTLVAYVVPGRDSGGKPVDAEGRSLTYERVRDTLSSTFRGDPKFNVAEVRLVNKIELLGTGKVALSLYQKAGKLAHDGEVLKL